MLNFKFAPDLAGHAVQLAGSSSGAAAGFPGGLRMRTTSALRPAAGHDTPRLAQRVAHPILRDAAHSAYGAFQSAAGAFRGCATSTSTATTVFTVRPPFRELGVGDELALSECLLPAQACYTAGLKSGDVILSVNSGTRASRRAKPSGA